MAGPLDKYTPEELKRRQHAVAELLVQHRPSSSGVHIGRFRGGAGEDTPPSSYTLPLKDPEQIREFLAVAETLLPEKYRGPYPDVVKLIDAAGQRGDMNFHFADSYHPSPMSHLIFSSPDVQTALKRNGFNTQVVEFEGNHILKEFREKGLTSQALSVSWDQGIMYQPRNLEAQLAHAVGYLRTFALSADGTRIIMPDPRGEARPEKLTVKESMMVWMTEHLATGPQACHQAAMAEFGALIATLPPELRALHETAWKREGANIRGGTQNNGVDQVDETITARVSTATGRPEGQPQTERIAWIYGSGHRKLRDLNPGTNLTLMEEPNIHYVPPNATDFAYVYHTREMLPPGQSHIITAKTPDNPLGLTPEQLVQCHTAVAHIKDAGKLLVAMVEDADKPAPAPAARSLRSGGGRATGGSGRSPADPSGGGLELLPPQDSHDWKGTEPRVQGGNDVPDGTPAAPRHVAPDEKEPDGGLAGRR